LIPVKERGAAQQEALLVRLPDFEWAAPRSAQRHGPERASIVRKTPT
jgi:hypothetical protein